MDSIEAIKKFLQKIGYTREDTPIELHVSAYVNNTKVYYKCAECFFSYQTCYMQYAITIDWGLDASDMVKRGLHAAYNTNFQEMKLSKESLYITGDNLKIILVKL